MPKRRIIIEPDPILRKKSENLEKVDEKRTILSGGSYVENRG